MSELNVVFGTNDGSNVAKNHFGDSKFFKMYKFDENGNYIFVKSVENEAKDLEEKKHGDDRKRAFVLDQMGPVDFMIAGVKSPNFKKINERGNAIPCVSKIVPIEENLNFISRNIHRFVKLKEDRVRRKIVPEIPVIEE